MFWITKWVAAPLLAVAFMAGPQASEAQADHGVRLQLGRFGLSIGGHHHGYYPSYGYGGHYGYPSYRSYHHGHHGHWYHDTTHWDYHPPQIVPHGNHYDYMPGHYDLHRSGHWHH